jgi:pyruvate formate lyase activating enzyme
MEVPLIVRIPLIPSFNTSDSELVRIFDVIRDLGLTEVHLLAYHSLGKGKYAALGREYALDGIGPPTTKQLDLAKELCAARGLKVSVGG